jgi:predicted O-methyltransferase YrrM
MEKKPSPALSTKIKDRLNSVLKVAGLQVGTTMAERLEQARLERLRAREHWAKAEFRTGLRFEPGRYRSFLKEVCGPYVSDFRSLPRTPAEAAGGYFLQNGWFESVDAEVLYSVIRHFQPRTIIEVGSGYSSLLARRAIRDGRLSTRLVCVDPQPRVDVRQCADGYIQSAAEELPCLDLIERLDANDLLFIDSSHVINTGGDVLYLYLQVMPRLRPGVLIHAHDIFLPFEYPEQFVRNRWGWNEQYLLYALLMNNASFEILWPSCYMWQVHREQVQTVIQSERSAPPPSSFWMVKR